jgi:hypothetical protein
VQNHAQGTVVGVSIYGMDVCHLDEGEQHQESEAKQHQYRIGSRP